jgi:multidrug efflux system outer membrane protein
MQRATAVFAVVATLAGCAPGQNYVRPVFPFLKGYNAAAPGASILLENVAWWQRMNDTTLDRLIALGLNGSLSLELARERVIEARAAFRAVPGAGRVTTSAGVRAEGIGSDKPEISGTGELGLSWMFDLWGARREQLRVAGADIDIAEAEEDAARLLVLYNLTNAYIALRYNQRQVTLTHQNIARSSHALRLTRSRQEAGSATRQEITRAQARVAQVRAQLPALKATVAGKINEISVLTGRAPGRLPRDLLKALHTPAPQPKSSMPANVGIPADLLRNRPDVRIAERRYYAAIAEIKIAQAALYPTLSLTGLISLDSLGNGTKRPEYYFGPSIQFPNLPLKNGRAAVELRHSQARQAHEAWKATVLTAILEVENALLDYGAVRQALVSAHEATRLYRETVNLTEQLLKEDEATVSDLIGLQRDVATAAASVADLEFRQAQGFVEINVRLGAGHRVGATGPSAVASPQRPSVRRDDVVLTQSD